MAHITQTYWNILEKNLRTNLIANHLEGLETLRVKDLEIAKVRFLN